MLCASLGNNSFEECRRSASRYPFIELRLDMLNLSSEEIAALCSMPAGVIATCRCSGMGEAEQRRRLLSAVQSGASYMDLEIEASDEQTESLKSAARTNGAQFILSYHDFSGTPARCELEKLIDRCFSRGADIAKIACLVNGERDMARLLGLLEMDRKLVVVGMGEKGKLSRVIAPLLGSLWTYAATSHGRETADGQLSVEECELSMKKLMEL